MKRTLGLKAWPAFPAFKDRRKLLRRLPDPASILRGSLFKRTIRHRRGCRVCRRGRGHTVWVVAVSYSGGRTRQFSIRTEQKKWVEKLMANYKKLKSGLEAICEMNLRLLRSRKRR
jgi:hypothetical protein